MKWQCLFEGVVERDWLDEYDHVNFLHYQRIADLASTSFWTRAMQSLAIKADIVVVETYVRYLRELRLGDPVTVDSAVAGYDSKRIHFLHQIQSGSQTSCVIEVIVLAFDLETRRASVFAPALIDLLASLHQADGDHLPASSPRLLLRLPGAS